MSWLNDLLAANEQYAARFDKGALPAPPARRLAILTCMDARIEPFAMLGLRAGDAHVIRNAGGRVTEDVLRSLVISSTLLGTRAYLVIHHTECGMQSFTNEELRERLRRERAVDAGAMDFLPFGDLEASVREDVEAIRRCPLLPEEVEVRGLVYDVRTGRLREVS